MNIPIKERPVIMSKNPQSICINMASPKKNPNNDLKAIITNEVPTATFISTLAKITRAGIIKNPPPAPTKPVIAPTTTPSNITKIIFFIKTLWHD